MCRWYYNGINSNRDSVRTEFSAAWHWLKPVSVAVGRRLKTSRVSAGKRTTAASANGRTLRCDHELLFQGEHAQDDVNRPGRINNVLHEV